MTRRRHRRRRLDGPPPPTASLTRVLLALYSIPLFYPNSAGSAVGVAAAAVAAGTEATPLKDKQQPDAADPAARDLQRQQDPEGRSSSGGVTGGGGQQEQSVDSRSGDTEEVPVGERTSIEDDLGQEGRQQRHGKPGDRHGKNEARFSQHPRGGGGSSSSSSGRKGREEDETRTPQAEHPSCEKDYCSKDTSTVNDGVRLARPPLLAPHARETEATPEALASAAERGASNGEGCGVGGCGGDGGVDAASSDDRWAAQTLGVPMALHHPLGEMSDALGFASARTTLQTIGGALPRVLEDSAWCDEVEETECFSAPSATKRADEERDETGEEEVIVGGFASDGLGFDSSRTAQTIGGTLPRILEDSAWCAGEEDCSSAPSVSVGGEKKREETREEKVAAGHSASNGLGFDSTRTVQTIGGALPRIVEDSAWCAGEEDCSSASADRERGQTREVQPALCALCARPSGEGEDGKAREGYGASTDEGVQAILGQGESTLEAGADGKCDGEHPGNGGSQAGRGAAAEGECKQNFPAVERQSPQEQRGPLVKGQGASIIATIDPRHGGEGDRADYGKGALDVEGTAEAGGQQGGGEEGVEGFLVTVLGKAWNSWKIIVCALVVGAVTFGMYLQGSLSRWLPFLHGSSRRGWLSDLDSVIANARSRTGTFCSPGGLSGDAAADDSDLPDLVSADGGDDGRIGNDHGPRNASDAGEAPLMWDTRPKPDDYLVFHPVLGVVPAGAVRAWGGDGRGGWNGGRVKRRSSVTAVASATNKGGAGALGDGVLSMSSPSLSYSTSTETTRVVGGKPISKVAVVGGRKGKELPPVRNTEEWFRWLASHEAAGAAVAAAVAGVEQARGSAEALRVPGKEEEAAAAAAAAELAASEALRVRASDFIKPVVVREEEALGRSGPACGGESERGRSGGGQQTVNTNGISSAGSREAAATTCAEMFADSQQQPPSADSSLTPAAIGLQLGIGSDELVCSTGESCTSVSGIASTEEGLSGPGSGTGDDGEGSSVSFGGGGAGAGGSGGRTSSSEDGSSSSSSSNNLGAVMAADCSPQRLSLSSAEQPTPMASAYQVL